MKEQSKGLTEQIMDFLKALLAILVSAKDFISEMATGGLLVPQTELVHGEALAGKVSLSKDIKYLAVRERDILFFETMVVEGTEGPYCTIKGFENLFSGDDHMKFHLNDKVVAKVQNKAKTRTYNLYRGTTEDRVGWIEKVGDDYGFYSEPSAASIESSETTKLANTEPSYKFSGDFINRRYLMKNGKGENVAKVKKQVIAFPSFDHYTVRIAPGMDPILVLACLYVIDEDGEDKIRNKLAEKAEDVAEKVEDIVDATLGSVVDMAKSGLSSLNPFSPQKK